MDDRPEVSRRDVVTMWASWSSDPQFHEIVDWSVRESWLEIFSWVVHHPAATFGIIQEERREKGLPLFEWPEWYEEQSYFEGVREAVEGR